jgi:polyisoprenoid-binding protein YceI
MKKQQHKVTWVVDPVHTRIRFSIRYLLLTSVSGWFTRFEGVIIAAADDFSDAQAQLSIFTSSLDTGNTRRDTHLRSANFFDVEKYPVISFESTTVETAGLLINMTGILRIKDVTEVIRFTVIHNGTVVDQLGNIKAGFEMESAFNRKDLHLQLNELFDTFGELLSDEVKIFCDVELLKLA